MLPIVLVVRLLLAGITIATNSNNLYIVYNNSAEIRVNRVLTIPVNNDTIEIKIVQK